MSLYIDELSRLEGFINAVNSTDFNPCMFDKNMFSTIVQ